MKGIVIEGFVVGAYVGDMFDMFEDDLYSFDVRYSDPEKANCAMSNARIWFTCEDKHKKTHLAYNLKPHDRVRVVCRRKQGSFNLVSINVFD